MSFNIFQKNIYDEIIKYNELNLKNTVDSYENHLVLIRNVLLSQSFNSKVTMLSNNSEPDYIIADQVRKELELLVTNPLFYLDNVILYFKDKSYIVQKNNVIPYSDFIEKYYLNDSFDADFWEHELSQQFLFRIYPAADFSDLNLGSRSYTGNYIPLVANNRYEANLSIIAFLDTGKLFRAFHHSINNNFMILDNENRVIFSSDRQYSPDSFPNFEQSSGYEKIGNRYYFYKKGNASKLTYINTIPLHHISSKILNLKIIFFTLLIASVIISFIISVWLSVKFNNPIKKIIESMQDSRSTVPLQSKIKEFDAISSKISDILLANHTIQEDLATKNSLVQYYAYINKLKRIHTGMHSMQELHFADKPFVLILARLSFKSVANGQAESNEEKVTYYFREFINCILSENFTDTHTFQIEKDQILSIVFLQDQENIMPILERMKQVFDIDKTYCAATIALSPVENHSSQLTMAYQLTLRLLEQRALRDDTQIITALESKKASTWWTTVQEQEFLTKLSCGNADATIDMLFRLLQPFFDNEAPAAQIYDFCQTIITKVKKEFPVLQLHNGAAMNDLHEQINQCHTANEIKQLLTSFVESVTNRLAEQEKNHDPTIRFVTNYLNDHLDADVSLDFLADKLNISSGYLSTYFKEKTGNNYMDYVNNLRIDRAKQLLQNQSLYVQTIAEKVGYGNVNSFIRMFKKFTGITPGEYRRKHSTME
ncbi:helix-turn-helix domain-containing protein [Paenibacillus sp. GXUN7292]|uniref:helix-turn-helix domain-containing protein n=1 Tax=Paenibacillus sp. GXUN7292 TaxID=3422499 RepID=UPI003D7F0105